MVGLNWCRLLSSELSMNTRDSPPNIVVLLVWREIGRFIFQHLVRSHVTGLTSNLKIYPLNWIRNKKLCKNPRTRWNILSMPNEFIRSKFKKVS